MKNDKQLITDAAARFPKTFGLRAFPGETFTINLHSSYVNDAGTVQLYTGIKRYATKSTPEHWADFAKCTEAELAADIVILAAPKPPAPVKITTAQREALVEAADSHTGQFYFATRRNPQGETFLKIAGLIAEDHAVRDAIERDVLKREATQSLELAAAALTAGNLETAARYTQHATFTLAQLTKTFFYITDKGRAAVADLGTKAGRAAGNPVHQGVR